ncbi:DUF2254 domain-containing protein [Pedobacter sandarakinus]|uniref:DUF2254 domain-containing protein n=1 Tax=Pedobacter sandarakinus TaxID=353156 RepID=UPI0022454E1E|nr:DUF2254 domain-containing protein [Pedobacter sandarakinus]MCX2574135.1 DUF2254 domain-containing protein [Pedobacter sandarakinus]
MDGRLVKWLRSTYKKIVTSIAFYPAIIAIVFLFFSWIMLELDFSETGKLIKANHEWIRLKDASTARSIVSTITGGIISLMVFSFSMVMILLNQAASQMSNRMLEGMIGNRFQQIVLGTYIGTIVYSLFLLSTIRDIDSGVYVPALSIYVLVLLTITDIFTFIYFLHYVTQSAKFETIIHRVHQQTFASLKARCDAETLEQPIDVEKDPQILFTKSSGTYQGFDAKALLKITNEYSGLVKVIHPPGSYLLYGQPMVEWYGRKLTEEEIEKVLLTFNFYIGQPVGENFYYGLHQLTEVALKALSPGINDPETAVLSLNALMDLFAYRLSHHPKLTTEDSGKKVRIITTERTFKDLFNDCILPIWDYGKNDLYIQQAMLNLLSQLQSLDVLKDESTILERAKQAVRLEMEKR